ncbi:gamma-tubulin complex component 5 [Capsicum galapagoense]
MEGPQSLISKLHTCYSDGLHFAKPISSLRTNEFDLVRNVLQILQGLSSTLLYWDEVGRCFRVRSGIYVSHLSHTSLYHVLNQFTYAATCLKMVESSINKVAKSVPSPPPTLRAFCCSISTWLTWLRNGALKEEMKVVDSCSLTTPTLLGLSSSLSSLCAGTEFLFQLVQGAIPQAYDETNSSISATTFAVHILDYLYKKLTEVCLVQGGEEDAYRMILHAFVSSLLPYIEGLDSWLYEGILDDPFEEMFFRANKRIAVEESEFWEKSYLLRSAKLDNGCVTDSLLSIKRTNDVSRKELNDASGLTKEKEAKERDSDVCPLFIKEIARDIISAGKSLQLVQHTSVTSSVSASGRIAGLSLSEIFCVTLSALIGYGDHISEYFFQEETTAPLVKSFIGGQKIEGSNESFQEITCSDKEWCKFLVDTMAQKGSADHLSCQALGEEVYNFDLKGDKLGLDGNDILSLGFHPENPAITTSHKFLHANRDAWGPLSLSREYYLPPLNDEGLRQAIFDGSVASFVATKNTNYTFGFQFGESERDRLKEDVNFLEELFPFPTLLPPFQEEDHVSEVFPFQENSTLPSRTLNWIGRVEPRNTPLPTVILQECLLVFIKKQADCIGRNILSKLLREWRLLEELEVLRAIYLLGSGDLLQHFLTVVFNKLDKGEGLDDDFELNTTLQESIRYSADATLLSTPDALVVSVTRNTATTEDDQRDMPLPISTPRKSRGQNFGIDGLDSLMFTYKVPWPLELIANTEAIKKYNQVMRFLLKVRRAKFVLDKARRWMWKDRSSAPINRKHHWLLEQKLLHFVDAFHHYVMDRVYHSAWGELCEGLAAARSLDEVIEIHEAYLTSIQRQCFAVPEKLWALIASRINSILGLALDFYSVQQTLSSGGAVSAIKARCEMEINRIEKQFDDCIAFLMRILSFKLNVGQFPHLADLVTRINYNHFYMSHNGSLIYAPGSNAVPSKSGKLFAGQRD